MGDKEKSKEQMVSPDVDITKDAASKILAVELNKRLKPKENEQDPIPSDDDEDAYPELHLKKEDIERIKKAKLAEQNKGNS